MSEWISADERQPGDCGAKRIVYIDDGKEREGIGNYYPECGGWWTDYCHKKVTVLRWMPITTAPKDA